MNKWEEKVAVVTGASAGIGLAIAKSFVSYGMIVIGLARREQKMKDEMSQIKGPGKFYAKACDVTKKEDVSEIFNWIERNFQSVHILINNAGIFIGGSLLEMKLDDLDQVVNTNLMGVLYCSLQAVKLMKKNDHEAHIINMNSLSGHKIPLFEGLEANIYPATKFGLTALTESFSNSLFGTKIRLTNCSPGLVKTDLFKNCEDKIKNAFESIPSLSTNDIVHSVLHIISTPQNVHITQFTIKPLAQHNF